MLNRIIVGLLLLFTLSNCDKNEQPSAPSQFSWLSVTADGKTINQQLMDVSAKPVINLHFSAPIDTGTVRTNITLIDKNSNALSLTYSFQQNDSNVVIVPNSPLPYFSPYLINVNGNVLAASKGTLTNPGYNTIITSLDPSDKFPRITDDQLMDSVQRRTLSYFWEFGHPVSGMARERNSSDDIVTSGGTGFGIMAMVAGVNRGFITRNDARDRIIKIVDFLQTKCTTYHGAFAHWINGASGVTVPFSANDNGGDLVETSYLIQGLLSAREYFNLADPIETSLRTKINAVWEAVEWDWYRKNNENVLYWHWSGDKGFIMNMRIQGWNETLITYIMAASSPTHSIPLEVYDQGFARNGGMKNGNQYYGYTLPLGPSNGGPLFFAHYSFLGIDPRGLKDKWADYEIQVRNHSLINYAYCVANPKKYYGYSDSCWGLTASDDAQDTLRTNPTMITEPSVQLPPFLPLYTPTQSMAALHYYYYKLGDKTWRQYGFIDAFALQQHWFANSFLAIDQGPIIIMLENHRSGLLWNLMKTCPEVKLGMKKLGFTAPYL